MSLSIPSATPFPWSPDDLLSSVQSHKLSTSDPNASTSAGFAHVQKELQNSSDSDSCGLSTQAKSLLSSLLTKHKVKLPTVPTVEDTDEPPATKKQKTLQAVNKSMSDETILKLASTKEVSFLGSILSVVHEASGPVSTRTFITSCCLAIPPGSVPTSMGAKEMVMAALHLLSSTPATAATDADTDTDADTTTSRLLLQQLPLIMPVQMVPDLEKRNYLKASEWQWPDLHQDELQELDAIFLGAVTGPDYQWLPRQHFLPAVFLKQPADAYRLVLKGVGPPQWTGRCRTTPLVRKKKALSPLLPLEQQDLHALGPTPSANALNAIAASGVMSMEELGSIDALKAVHHDSDEEDEVASAAVDDDVAPAIAYETNGDLLIAPAPIADGPSTMPPPPSPSM